MTTFRYYEVTDPDKKAALEAMIARIKGQKQIEAKMLREMRKLPIEGIDKLDKAHLCGSGGLNHEEYFFTFKGDVIPKGFRHSPIRGRDGKMMDAYALAGNARKALGKLVGDALDGIPGKEEVAKLLGFSNTLVFQTGMFNVTHVIGTWGHAPHDGSRILVAIVGDKSKPPQGCTRVSDIEWESLHDAKKGGLDP
jgi:hypothetical protein